MLFVGIVIGIIIFAAMVYMALKKQASFATRLAALIALAVMILTVMVCLFLILFGTKAPVDESIVLVTGIPEDLPKSNSDVMIMLMLAVFLVGLFLAVMILSIRESRKTKSAKNKLPSGFY